MPPGSRHRDSYPLRRPRILIIEDTLLIAMFLNEIAQSCGCEITETAYTLQEARDAISGHNYDAVLLDVGLQNDRTFEIADVLMRRNVPFAFITGYAEILEVRHQDTPVLLEPFSTDALINTICGLVDAETPVADALTFAG